MAELYFEIGCKKNILRKTILKFMNQICGIFGKKLILKHFMNRTISKRCVLGSILNRLTRFWGLFYMKKAPFYIFVIFLWVQLLRMYLYFTRTQKQIKKFLFTNSYIFGICSWMVFLSIFAKNQETFILTWILLFRVPIKLVLSTYGPFSWRASHIFQYNRKKISWNW